ncbi:Peptaibiotic Nonribosomal peptide synthetase [Paramyrothecium foliicola]|nr:Peptaibiotic Nonribosomal peptide synthetase [Paramyrothecium foliicola]
MEASAKHGTEDTLEGCFNYPLVVQGQVSDSDVDLVLTCDSGILEEAQMTKISQLLENVVRALATSEKKNQPEIVDTTIHESIAH